MAKELDKCYAKMNPYVIRSSVYWSLDVYSLDKFHTEIRRFIFLLASVLNPVSPSLYVPVFSIRIEFVSRLVRDFCE